jgi:hypothetical protein
VEGGGFREAYLGDRRFRLRSTVWVQGLGFALQGLGCRGLGLGSRFYGFRFRACGGGHLAYLSSPLSDTRRSFLLPSLPRPQAAPFSRDHHQRLAAHTHTHTHAHTHTRMHTCTHAHAQTHNTVIKVWRNARAHTHTHLYTHNTVIKVWRKAKSSLYLYQRCQRAFGWDPCSCARPCMCV